jgi:hypothetical protein
MNSQIIKFVMLFAIVASLTSCSTMSRTMREPNARLNFTKSDFTLSDQVSAEAKSTKILMIDFARIFKQESGSIEGPSAAISAASIPVIGSLMGDKTSSYALFELMKANPGYDVVFYPQYETTCKRPILGLGFIFKTTTVKTTARLGKLNK